MPRTIVLCILGTALVLVVLVTIRAHRQDGRDQVTIRRGDSIAAALEQFARAEHRYPDSLRELVPRYLPSLPPPGPGYQYWRLWRRSEERRVGKGCRYRVVSCLRRHS